MYTTTVHRAFCGLQLVAETLWVGKAASPHWVIANDYESLLSQKWKGSGVTFYKLAWQVIPKLAVLEALIQSLASAA